MHVNAAQTMGALIRTTNHLAYWLGRRAAAAIAQIRHQVKKYCTRRKKFGEGHNECAFISVSPTRTPPHQAHPAPPSIPSCTYTFLHLRSHVHPRTYPAHLRPSSPTPFAHPVTHTTSSSVQLRDGRPRAQRQRLTRRRCLHH